MSNSPNKRGLLRPAHSGRVPVYIIITVITLACLFFYNLYSNSVVKSELQAQNDDIREQMLMCYKSKLEAEQKFETLTETCKQKFSSEQKAVSTLRASLKQHKSKNANLEQNVTDTNSRLADLMKKVQTLNMKLSKSEDLTMMLKQENSQLARQLAVVSLKNEQLSTQNTKLTATIERTPKKSSLPSKSQSIPVSEPDVSRTVKDSSDSGQFLNRTDNQTDLNDTESVGNATVDGDLNKGDWILSNKLQREKLLLEQGATFKKSAANAGPRYMVQGEVTKPHDNADETGFLDAAVAMNVGSKLSGSSSAAQNNASIGYVTTLRQVPPSRIAGSKDGSAEVLDISQENTSKSKKPHQMSKDENDDANQDYV